MRQAIRNFLNLFLFWLFSFLLHRIVFVLYHIVKKQDFNFIDFGKDGAHSGPKHNKQYAENLYKFIYKFHIYLKI